MKKAVKTLSGMISLLLVTFALPGLVLADSGPSSNKSLEQQVQSLTSMLEQYRSQTESLQKQLSEQQTQQQMLEKQLSQLAVQSGGEPIVPESATFNTSKFINVSGYVEASYNFNFERPSTTSAGNSTLRAFDRDENNFGLNAVKVTMEREAPETGGVGFRFDLMYGLDSRILTQGGESTDSLGGGVSDELVIEQAYIHGIIPNVFGQPVDIKVGRFVTLVGTEVIESLDNWLPSRSLLFNNAIPFIHTGIRASRALPLFEDYATLTLGLNNGWDQALDNNDFKTVEGALTIENVVPKMSTTFAMLYGPEQGSPVTGAENGNKRGVITIINSYDVNDKLSISGEYDYGFEKQAVGASTTGRADWHGFAFYARYAFTEKFALSGRLEYFKDSDGARTGLEQSIWSYAIGADYWIYEDLLARLEFRQDLSNSDTFDANPDLTLVGTTDKQETIMGSLIYTF